MKRLLLVLMVVVVLAGLLVAPVSAHSGNVPTFTYVVQPGDTLAKIGRQYCTSWQEIYALNRATIGPDPDVLEPGTVLQVPNRCGGTPRPDGVYDHGPSHHARGTVNGNVYTVAFGDTMYSIAKRFGLTVDQLAAANGIWDPSRIYGGQKLIIPGLGSGPSGPFITISSPAANSVLQPTFTVSGTGGGLFEGGLVVRALDKAGNVLAEQPATLQGPDVGAGGTGTYSVQITVHVSQNTAGKIVASASSPKDGSVVASASVAVTFSPSAPQAFITISSPPPGAILPPTFVVTGTGGGLFEGGLMVRAVDNAGHVLAQQPATLQGQNVGAGGTGTYSVQLTVHVAQNTAGKIVASASSPKDGSIVASASVAVTFSASSVSYKKYSPGQCIIQGKANAPLYSSPGGQQVGQFVAGGSFEAMRGAKVSGGMWYEIQSDPGSGNPPVWAPASSTTSASSGCAF